MYDRAIRSDTAEPCDTVQSDVSTAELVKIFKQLMVLYQAGEDSPAAVTESAASSAVTEEFDTLMDDILAYEFKYPVKIGERHLPIIPSRKPERYSSAAPLSADARQRIVSELVSFQDRVTISVTVGPASGKLATKPLQDWTAREVADTVLQDRSTARVTTGQRVSLNTIEEAATETRDGHTYWAYEHTSQGSPSLANRSKETYRHSWSVTSHRPGLDGKPYLYTLTLSCPDEEWPQLGPLYAQAQQSFRLVDTTEEYVPPDKDPWRFF
ncbi:g10324 [Coccomyxa elongata]